MSQSLKQYLANFACSLLPATRCYGLKRGLWRLADVQVGNNVRMVSSVKINTNGAVTLKDHCFLGHETMIVGGNAPITIGKHVGIGPRVTIVSGTHDISTEEPAAHGPGKSLPIIIGDGVWIGANVTILAGVTIGEMSVIAAGTVVSKNVPPRTLVGGVPAKLIKDLNPNTAEHTEKQTPQENTPLPSSAEGHAQ